MQQNHGFQLVTQAMSRWSERLSAPKRHTSLLERRLAEHGGTALDEHRGALPQDLLGALRVLGGLVVDPLLRSVAYRALLAREWASQGDLEAAADMAGPIREAIQATGLHPLSVALVYPGDPQDLVTTPKPRLPAGGTEGPVLVERFEPHMEAQRLAACLGAPDDLIAGIEWDHEVRADDQRRLGRVLRGFDLVIPQRWSDADMRGLEGLAVPGTLVCGASGVKHLPETLAVGADLILGGSAVERIPGRMAHLGTAGALDIQGVPLKGLPSGFHVRGDLFAGYTEFHEVMGLDVDGNCDFAFSFLGALRRARVAGDLMLDGTPIRELGSDVEVGGRILLGRCSELPSRDAVAPRLRDKVAQWPKHLGGRE